MNTGRYCEESECEDNGRTEFCGFCAYHWLDLEPEKKNELLARYEPDTRKTEPTEVQVIERVRTIYPARSWLAFATLWVWRVGLSALVAWLTWRAVI